MPNIDINENRCKGCERCIFACPQQVLGMSKTLNEKGYLFAEVRKGPLCIGCRLCAITCPDVAIEVGVHGVQYAFFEY